MTSRSRLWYVTLIVAIAALLCFSIAACAAPAPAPAPTPATAATPAPSPAPAPVAAEPIKWRVQSPFPTTSAQHTVWGKTFVDQINSKSGGRIKAELFPPGAIISATTGPEILDGVAKGVVEAALSAGSYLGGIMPMGDIEYYGLPVTSATAKDIFNFWFQYKDRAALKMIQKSYEPLGVKNLMGGTVRNAIGTKFQMTKLDDLKGKKMYASGIVSKLMSSLGASPVTLASAELYTGLQRGTVDGYVHAEYVVETYKLKEVCKYLNFPPVNSGTTQMLVNLPAYKKLPADLQKVIDDAGYEAAKAYADDYDKIVADSLAKAKAEGVQVVTLPDAEVAKLRAAATTVWEEVANKSPAARELYDFMKEYYTSIKAM